LRLRATFCLHLSTQHVTNRGRSWPVHTIHNVLTTRHSSAVA
jgi:hypothetical protein